MHCHIFLRNVNTSQIHKKTTHILHCLLSYFTFLFWNETNMIHYTSDTRFQFSHVPMDPKATWSFRLHSGHSSVQMVWKTRGHMLHVLCYARSENPKNLTLGEGKRACNQHFPEQGRRTALGEQGPPAEQISHAGCLGGCFKTMRMSHFEVT